ncbi:hypothetical protein D791_03856 [Nitrincola nitratireducens]|uniref:DUF1653 domain-containing protein n=1 Tax=Nitrincola nitratireducens TaxID=1229521 RepID=W9VEU0_9GAMM|nr:hypothetical protein D791_03856 [Nitrincola nitratireducens]
MLNPTPGRYRHFKGAEYEVIECARHSETEEWYVVYRPLYGDRGSGFALSRCSVKRLSTVMAIECLGFRA